LSFSFAAGAGHLELFNQILHKVDSFANIAGKAPGSKK